MLIDPVAIQIGPIATHWYGVIYVVTRQPADEPDQPADPEAQPG